MFIFCSDFVLIIVVAPEFSTRYKQKEKRKKNGSNVHNQNLFVR